MLEYLPVIDGIKVLTIGRQEQAEGMYRPSFDPDALGDALSSVLLL